MKNKVVAGVLALFLGGLGIHKFYLNKAGQGVLYLLFCWTLIPAIIAFIEAIVYFTMSDKEFDFKYNGAPSPYQQNQNLNKSNVNVSDEIEKLHSLKEKGIISEQEFEYKKRRLLQL
jgi:TM2 domain-containing membrane protein YozV